MKLSRLLLLIAAALVTAAAGRARSADLYEVLLHSHKDAAALRQSNADVLMSTRGGYLILADARVSAALLDVGLDARLIASDVTRSEIAIDRRRDRRNAERYEVLFEQGGLRLLRVGRIETALSDRHADLFPLRDQSPVVEYYEPSELPGLPASVTDIIDSLTARVSQDTLTAWLTRLDAFHGRLTGTDSNYAARDWLVDKFQSFGYDSVMIDPFTGSQLWDRVPCQSYNVIAVKPGTVAPEKQIVIGAHFDAVPDAPGADDNSSGTCCVLEAARVLADVDLPMTVIFVGFDSEESWMWGSYHYRDDAVARGDDIVFMFNPDMIGHYQNTDSANLYYGGDNCLAQLWNRLAGPQVGIQGALGGSTASDHLPFQEIGIPVVFVQEGIFSTEYHQPTDNIAHISFPYMTRMVKATIATLYTAATAPAPVTSISVRDNGDGQALWAEWTPTTAANIAFYRVYWDSHDASADSGWVDLPVGDSTYLIEGLVEGVTYTVEVRTVDLDGVISITAPQMTGTPYNTPRPPQNFTVLPAYQAIRLSWDATNTELDFDHYAVIRDGQMLSTVGDGIYIDSDLSIGTDYHEYRVAAVDHDANMSDTLAVVRPAVRAATLEPTRILAVNRTKATDTWSDEQRTGAFLREALTGSNVDYRSDTIYTNTPATNPTRLLLDDLISYETVVIGSETPGDPFAFSATLPFLDTLAWYVSIGGKLVVFGRFGNMASYEETTTFLSDNPGYNDSYDTVFDISSRTATATVPIATVLTCDLVGAHSTTSEYPDLVWDSAATVGHSSIPNLPATGVYASSFADVKAGAAEVLYTYDSRDDTPDHEGQPVAWRHIGQDYSYVWFELPLTCFDHEAAVVALRQAVNDVTNQATSVDDPDPTLPYSFALAQNYPNPFNPTTRIDFSLDRGAEVRLTIFNLLGQEVRVLVDGHRTAGRHSVAWDGRNGSGRQVATGIYLYRLEAGDRRASRKMLLLK